SGCSEPTELKAPTVIFGKLSSCVSHTLPTVSGCSEPTELKAPTLHCFNAGANIIHFFTMTKEKNIFFNNNSKRLSLQ
ncbi:MAG: hypothetical protein ACI857_002352, partial [Arenicella sp.]